MTHIQQPTEHAAQASNEHVTIQSPFMTVEEIATYFRISTKTVYRKTKLGLLKGYKDPSNRRLLFDKKENRIKE